MPTCFGCKRPITGAYMNALGQSWHADCFRCAGCGQPIGENSFQTRDNRPYHAACFHAAFSPRCAGCNQPLTGAYITALGKNWHPEHFVCARCGKPFQGQGFHEQEGKAYCERDYQELFGRRCAAGGELIGRNQYFEKEGKAYCEAHYFQLFGKRCAIGGEYLKGEYVVNGWGESYCREHAAGLSECYSCGRVICQPLTGGGVKYADGRAMCNRCRQTAVDANSQGEPILARVRQRMQGWGLAIGAAATPLRLADQGELARLTTKTFNPKPAGMASHRAVTQNGAVIERQVEAILILHGLPAEHFAAIAAHELCHTYLFMNAFPELESLVEEGLCELVQYLWLREQNTPAAQHRIERMDQNDHPVYGEGYRAARRAYERMGLAGLLTYVRRERRFPA